jgi:DNA-binding transcriptional MerR regulator
VSQTGPPSSPEPSPPEPPAATGELLRIGEVARRVNVSCRTLRYYEELGLLEPTGYTSGGARRYSERDVVRVERIRQLQRLMGFDLDEIGSVLEAEDRLEALRAEAKGGPGPRRRLELLAEATALNQRLQEEVRAKLEALGAFLGELEDYAERYRQRRSELEALDDSGEAREVGVQEAPAGSAR